MDSLSTKVVATAAVAGIGLWVLWGRKKSWGGKSSGAVSQLDAVGGHGSKANKGPPILSRDGMILKPFQPAQPGKGKSRGELEADFYKEVNEKNLPIKEFIPKYHGTQVHDGVTYLVMENMTYGLKEPCVLDLKMGQRTYDETATAKKIEREKKKYPPQEVIGFRIVGMKVFRPRTGETWRSERDWCMQITPETMPNAIEQFFFDGRMIRHKVIEQVQTQLNAIEKMLKEHPMWRMYGSSLLLVFDGAEETPKIRVKMIDFAHIFDIKDGGVDSGYLHGVQFLKNALDSIVLNASGSMQSPSQVGGAHGNISSKDGEVVKKEDKKEAFDIEVDFYEKAWNSANPDALTRCIPKLIRVNQDASPRELVISDATCLVKNPTLNPLSRESVSIMDIKLGLRSFRSDCPTEPKTSYYSKYATFEQTLSPGRTEEIWKELTGKASGPKCLAQGKLSKRDYLSFRDSSTTSTELGFRLTALVHRDYKVSQNESRSVETRAQFLYALERFLTNKNGTFDLKIASKFVNQLNEILHAANDSKLFAKCEMVGTSLLFLHCDGNAAIRWIDFANSVESDCADRNGITQGIHCLSLAMQELIQKYQS